MRPARISHTRCGLRRFKKPTGQEPRAARCGRIGQAWRRTLSASSTGPSGCLSAGIFGVGQLNRMARYAFRRPTPYLPRRKSNAGRMECEKCGLVVEPQQVVLWQPETADRRFGFEATMRPVPIVPV